MAKEDIIIEILEQIYQELIIIREHLTRDKLAEMEEQAELTKRYMKKQEILNDLAITLLRDGKIDPRELWEASDKLGMEPETLEKEVVKYLEKVNTENI